MKKLLLIITALLVFCSCSKLNNEPSKETKKESQEKTEDQESQELLKDELINLAKNFTEKLKNSETEEVEKILTDDVKNNLSGKLGKLFSGLEKQFGKYSSIIDEKYTKEGDYNVVELELKFDKQNIIEKLVFDKDKKISGLWYKPGQINEKKETIKKSFDFESQEVTVDAGEGFPLKGMLLLPKEIEKAPALILLQGSGPQDKDETIGSNKPLKDIAEGLAKKGIITLRYDKRTYKYQEDLANSENYKTFTIDQEFVNDAVSAIELLKSNPKVDPDKIFILGHSMSGGYLSYINYKNPQVRGYISLAGSLRKMWEISNSQVLALAEELEKSGRGEEAQEYKNVSQANMAIASRLADMSEEESLDPSNSIYGIYAYYFRHMASIDSAGLFIADKKPLLVLQGLKDRQVTEEDLDLWKSALKDHPDMTIKEYENLNHLFGNYTGQETSLENLISVEYQVSTPVDQKVIEDINTWILEKSK